MDRFVKGRKLIIYGVGEVGKFFWNQNRSKLDIFACTCSDKEFEPLNGLKAIDHEGLTVEENYVIICSTYYEEIRRKLVLMGFQPGKDFMRWDFFESMHTVLLEEKELILAVGQCEISEMCYGLSQLKQVNRRYSIICLDERKVCIHGDKYCLEDYIDYKFFADMADIFLCPTVFSEKSAKGFALLKEQLKTNTKEICVSIFDYDGYWPQDIDRGRNFSKYYMTRKGVKLAAYCARDQVVERLVDEGMSASIILNSVMRKDFFDCETVVGNQKKSIKRAILTDRIADVKISDFVAAQYNQKKLYCDRGHFNQNLLREYVFRLAEYLDVEISKTDIENVDLDCLFTKVNEFPIYPSTAAYLGLDYIDESTKYRMSKYDNVYRVSFEEYMDNLIHYYMNVKEVLKYC